MHDNNVEFIILAEFDMDKGSIIKMHYPGNIVLEDKHKVADCMLPEGVHARVEDFTIFKWQQFKCYNIVHTKHDQSVRRGASIKAIALGSRYNYYTAFRPLLQMALEKIMKGGDELKMVQYVFDVINGIDLSVVRKRMGVEYELQRRMLLRSMPDPSVASNSEAMDSYEERKVREFEFQTIVAFDDQHVPIQIPMFLGAEQQHLGKLTHFIHTFGHDTMVIFNAVLTQQRIVVLGYNQPAGLLCNFVLSIVHLLSPPIFGLDERQFPYANLTDLEFLKVEGYIAGVTNPMFQQKREWWDVCCDIATGQVICSERDKTIAHHLIPDKIQKKLMKKVIRGMEAGYCEDWIRHCFQTYTRRYIVDEELLGHVNHRIQRWQRSRSYEETTKMNNLLHATSSKGFNTAKTGVPLDLMVRQLASGTIESSNDVENVFRNLVEFVRDEDECLELMSHLPQILGGVDVLGQGLLHKASSVRKSSVRILQKLEMFTSTKSFVKELNPYMLTTYHRVTLQESERTT